MKELVEGNLHYFHELTDGCAMGAEPLIRAEWLLERGDFAEVEAILAGARHRAEAKEQLTTLLNIAFTLARLRAAEGRIDEAVAVLEAWRQRVEATRHVDFANCLDLAVGYLSAVLGRHEAIPEWLREGQADRSRQVVQMLGFIHIVRAKALLVAKEYERLDAVAKSLPMYFGPFNNLFGHIHAKALEAIAAKHLYGMDKALDLFREAAALARPDGIVLSLAEYGRHLLPLVRKLSREAPNDTYLVALARQTRRFAGVTAGTTRRVGERLLPLLTPREEEMLRLVSRGKTNAEIARRLGVVVDTVKRTLTSAFDKLGARNRTEAAKEFTKRIGDHSGLGREID